MNNGSALRSKLMVGLAVLIGLAVIIGLTIVILKIFIPHHSRNGSVAVQQQKPTTKGLVAQLQKPGTIAALSGFTVQPATGTPGGLVYRQAGQSYDVYVASSDGVTYIGQKPLDFATASTEVSSMLKPYGLTESNKTNSSVSPGVTYTGDTIICHFGGSNAGKITSYNFACLTKDAITAEYATDAKLLAIYKKAVPSDTQGFTLVSRTYAKQDNKQSAILSLTSSDNKTKPRMLMFGAIDNQWEYITDINSGTINSGKYMISAEALQALHNPKYGTFLLDQLP